MSIIKSIGITTVGTFIGQVFILVYTILFAKYFGTKNPAADAFTLSFAIITIFTNEIIGIINAVFIPVYTKYREKFGSKDANSVFNASMGVLFVITVVLMVIVIVLAPAIASISGSNFSLAKRTMTSNLLYLTAILVVLLPLTMLFANMLNTFNHFVVPAFGRAVTYLVVLLSMLFLLGSLNIYSIVVGLITGTIVFFIMEYFTLKKKTTFILDFRFNHPALKEMYILSVPLFFASAANQINIFVEKSVAGSLEAGTISSLNYAIQLTIFPVTLGVTSVMMVLFPKLSEQIGRDDFVKVKMLLYRGLKFVLLIFSVYAIFLMVFPSQFVKILLMRGEFTAESLAMTSDALSLYAPGVIGLSGIMVLAKIYHSFKDMKTLTKIGIASMAVNIFLIIMLVSRIGYAGIPISFSIVSTVHFIALFIILQNKIRKISKT